MSDSEQGQLDLSNDNDKEGINGKKQKIQKSNKQLKKGKKPGKAGGFMSSTYRTQKCDFFNKGNCLKGDLCTYSHDFEPDTSRKICKFFMSGSCTKGEECQYSHNTKIYPCKFYHIQNRCNLNLNCRFSHSPIPADFYQEYMKDNKDFILKLYKEGKLTNRVADGLQKDLVQFIRDDLSKKDSNPPPMMPIVQNPLPKAESKTAWTNALKKDPRQRFRPKVQSIPVQSPAEDNKPIKEEEQKKIQVKEECLKEKFLIHLKRYFYSYY